MTSEDALWELMHNAIKNYNKGDIFRLRVIKRDLEILEILKKNTIIIKDKEELEKIKKLIFIIGEILVDESKQDISPEEAIQRIRKTCNKYWILK